MLPLLFFILGPALGDTPEKTFEELKKAVTDEDWDSVYELLAPSEKEQITKQMDLMRKNDQALSQLATMIEVPEDKLKQLSGKEVAILFMGKMAVRDKERFEREIGKIRSGTITGKELDGNFCLLKYKSGDKEGELELIRVEGKWYYSDVGKSQRASNERNASTSLKTLVTAQADFRANDRDGDRVANYWVKDVAGLYGLETGGEKIGLIMIELAEADKAAGKGIYPSVKRNSARAGYHFVVLKRYVLDGASNAYDNGTGRNVSRFGFAAYPERYGRLARKTFIINEENVVYWKDTQGRAPTLFPEIPRKEGWVPLN